MKRGTKPHTDNDPEPYPFEDGEGFIFSKGMTLGQREARGIGMLLDDITLLMLPLLEGLSGKISQPTLGLYLVQKRPTQHANRHANYHVNQGELPAQQTDQQQDGHFVDER